MGNLLTGLASEASTSEVIFNVIRYINVRFTYITYLLNNSAIVVKDAGL